MLSLELKYLDVLKNRFKLYKQISQTPFVSSFKCPLCGDSKKSKTKKRAYIYEKGLYLKFFCHNCGASISFYRFLEEQDPYLFYQYKLDWMRSQGSMIPVERPEPDFKTSVKFEKKIDFGVLLTDCQEDDAVLQYAKDRRIPECFFNSLFSCQNVMDLVSQLPRYSELELNPTPCLVIPFFDKERKASYVSVRNINKHSKFRYVVLEIDSVLPKLWGLEFIDWTKPSYIFEGPIDAMCVKNSLALAGSVGLNAMDYILSHINNKKDVCFVYDNEIFSNPQIFNQVQKKIAAGFSVVLYDKTFLGKDMNEVYCNDTMTLNEIATYLKTRTFSGLTAKLELANLAKPYNR